MGWRHHEDGNGKASCGKVGTGLVWSGLASLGEARLGGVGQGLSTAVSASCALIEADSFMRLGEARQGVARRGQARFGTARQGMGIPMPQASRAVFGDAVSI